MNTETMWSESDWRDKIHRFLKYHTEEVGQVYEADEYNGWNGSRADILTEQLAIEVDQADKWFEAVGRVCLYGIQYKREQVVVLLCVHFGGDQLSIDQCQVVCENLGIHLWLVDTKKAELYVYGDRFDLKDPGVHSTEQHPIRKLKGF